MVSTFAQRTDALERGRVGVADQHVVVVAGRQKLGDHAADLAGTEQQHFVHRDTWNSPLAERPGRAMHAICHREIIRHAAIGRPSTGWIARENCAVICAD